MATLIAARADIVLITGPTELGRVPLPPLPRRRPKHVEYRRPAAGTRDPVHRRLVEHRGLVATPASLQRSRTAAAHALRTPRHLLRVPANLLEARLLLLQLAGFLFGFFAALLLEAPGIDSKGLLAVSGTEF